MLIVNYTYTRDQRNKFHETDLSDEEKTEKRSTSTSPASMTTAEKMQSSSSTQSPLSPPPPPSRHLKPKLSIPGSDERKEFIDSLAQEQQRRLTTKQQQGQEVNMNDIITPRGENLNGAHLDKEGKKWLLEKIIEGAHSEEIDKWIRDKFDCHDNDLTVRTVVNTPLDRELNVMLHKAATHNHTGLVTWLIENGADIMTRNKLEATALHCAASNGCTSVLELLLSVTPPSQMEEKDFYGHAPLHLAVKNHHTEAVQTLIHANASLKTKTRGQKGMTALHLACAFGHDDIVEVLLDMDSSLFSMKDDEGMNPFLRSLCIETLPITSANGDVFVRTSKQNKVDLQGLLRTWIYLLGYDINACMKSTSNQKRNMMHLCSEFQNAEFIQLITMMANSSHITAATRLLFEYDKEESTPLHIAINMFNTHNNSITFDNAIRWETKLQLKNDDQIRSAIDNSMIIIECYLGLLDVENQESNRQAINTVDRKGNSPMHMLLLSLLRQQVMHQETLEQRQENNNLDDGMLIFEPILRQQYECYRKIIDAMTKSGVDMQLTNAQYQPIDDLVMQSVQNMKFLNRLLQSITVGSIKSPRSMRRLNELVSNSETVQGLSPKLVVGIEPPTKSPSRQSSGKNLVRMAIKSTKNFVNRAKTPRLSRNGSSSNNMRHSMRKNAKGNKATKQQQQQQQQQRIPNFDLGAIEVQSEDEDESTSSSSVDGDLLTPRLKFLSVSASSNSPTKGHLSIVNPNSM